MHIYLICQILSLLMLGGCTAKNQQIIKPSIKNNSIQNNKTNTNQDTNTKQVQKTFSTSFEKIEDFEGFFKVPQNYLGSTKHEQSSEEVHSGKFAHKAWVYGQNKVIKGTNTNHRGYPAIQLYKTKNGVFNNKVNVEFWVWLDISLEKTEGKNWFSFATFTSYADDKWSRTVQVNLDADNLVHLSHVPEHKEQKPDIFQNKDIKFPMKKWVKLNINFDYTNNNEYKKPFVKVFQDDQLVSASTFNPRANPTTLLNEKLPACLDKWDKKDIAQAEQMCELTYTKGMAQAHFGMYSPPLISKGVIYNDDLTITEIKE